MARDEGSTVTRIVDEALREYIRRRAGGGREHRARLPIFHGEGLQPGVGLNDTARLLKPIGDQP